MLFDNPFKVVFLGGLIIGSVVRSIYARPLKKNELKKSGNLLGEKILLSLNSLGFILPVVYIFSSRLNFADYQRPDWIGWSGAVLFAAAQLLLWKAHADLGKNFAPIVVIKMRHTLVTTGIYRSIRHPLYAAHWLWALAQGLLLPNWLAGWSFLLVFLPLYLIRIPKEEGMMLEEFGESYRSYMSTTGRIFPLFLKR